MNIWPFGKHKEEVRADTNPEAGQLVESDLLLHTLLGRQTITKEKAMEVPTVQACINLIAGTIASLPLNLYHKLEDGQIEEVRNNRTYLLNNDTGDTLTSSQFWRTIIEDYYLGKGGYAYINWAGLDVRSIHYVDESYISILQNTDPIFKDYDILVQGRQYKPYQFIKLLRKTRDGMRSRSIMEDNPLLLSVSYCELTYEENLVRKGGNKRGFLKSPNKLTDQAMDALKAAFRRLYQNSEENVVVLNNGIDFKEASNTSVEMQLNENKRTNAIEVCKLFGIPPAMVQGSNTTAGSLNEKDFDNFIRTCMAVMSDIECSLDRDLLLESEKGSFYWAFDTKELTRGNIKERYEAYKIGLEKNFLQIDEVREKEDMKPIGFEWITLGLDQVLFNPGTGQIYTPNTNALQDMNGMQASFVNENRTYTGENMIVTGPPGSGKTTWVQEQLHDGEIVLDLDAIKYALQGNKGFHDQAEELVPMLTAVRDAVYQAVTENKNPGKCYIITTENNAERLRTLEKELHASLKVMDTTKEVCKERVKQDTTRKDKEVFYQLIDEWFQDWEGGEKV
jgi:HK97 family phage portal protein